MCPPPPPIALFWPVTELSGHCPRQELQDWSHWTGVKWTGPDGAKTARDPGETAHPLRPAGGDAAADAAAATAHGRGRPWCPGTCPSIGLEAAAQARRAAAASSGPGSGPSGAATQSLPAAYIRDAVDNASNIRAPDALPPAGAGAPAALGWHVA